MRIVQVVFCIILHFPGTDIERANEWNECESYSYLSQFQSAGTNVEASLRVLASPGQHSSEVIT